MKKDLSGPEAVTFPSTSRLFKIPQQCSQNTRVRTREAPEYVFERSDTQEAHQTTLPATPNADLENDFTPTYEEEQLQLHDSFLYDSPMDTNLLWYQAFDDHHDYSDEILSQQTITD